jgi:hypothetical protein
VPLLFGIESVMLRAEIVVLDFLDAVPVAVRQSPTLTELTVSLTLSENVVVDVQLTVVWPLVGFWTSMLDALSAATLPEVPMGRFEAVAAPADALDPSIPAANSAAAPVPRRRAEPLRGVRRAVGFSMIFVASFVCGCWCGRADVELLGT